MGQSTLEYTRYVGANPNPARYNEIALSSVANNSDSSYRIAVVQWTECDGIADALYNELLGLGHSPSYFPCHENIPPNTDIVFSFAPYGSFLTIASQLERFPKQQRPVLIHWNTEGIPDLRLPWPLISTLGRFRSWMGRIYDSLGDQPLARISKYLLAWQTTRMTRFRYVGDYYYAYRKGWLHVFADSSEVYANIHRQQGLPTIHMPWGSVPQWYDDLRLERDIDVLWMGKRGTKRRSDILDRVRAELRKHGVEIYVADNVERPYIFDQERTQMLNRAKITLNLARTWFDDNFSRFCMAAPNRSLIVSEPLLPHCPQYVSGIHYAVAPVDQLAATILYYLKQDDERMKLVNNAYYLTTQELTMRNSIKRVIDGVRAYRAGSFHI